MCPDNSITSHTTSDSYDISEDKPADIEDNDVPFVTLEPTDQDLHSKRALLKAHPSQQRRKSKRLTKQELVKEKEEFFKTLSSLKVESVLDEGREALEADDEGVTELPFFCCNTCLEVYRTMTEYNKHDCKVEEQESGGAEVR